MITSDLVEKLAENWDMSKAETRRLLDTLVDTFSDQLAQGNSFSIPELGTFGTHTRSERRSYNPHYEKYMLLPPKRVVNFSPSKGLKEDLEEIKEEEQ
ncbi:MAG: HU family DNA-binding protein [Balneolaceae bacterium]|nr:HU family DNA-binding protein [Balneolaceae bacterium]